MSEMILMKTPSGSLVPADDESRELVAKVKTGQGVRAKVTKVRSLPFHRKGFALFKLAFDIWEPTEQTYKGEAVAKDFNRFRKDITILAGFFTSVYNVRGEVRLEAESLKFESMTEDRFALVYKAVLNVVWTKILRQAGYKSEADVDRVIDELLRFE